MTIAEVKHYENFFLKVIFAWSAVFCAKAAASSFGMKHSSRLALMLARGGGSGHSEKSASINDHDDSANGIPNQPQQQLYGRISNDEFRLTPEQIRIFHEEGCVTIPDVLTADEVAALETVFDRFVSGEITVPGKDFCDMSKPFDTPYEQWSIVNCMLPATYYPPLQGNPYERLTESMAQQLFAAKAEADHTVMVKDYDQFLNKRPGKADAVFAWHQDMAYWPGPDVLGVNKTDTCTFSLAIDDSDQANGCLRYVVPAKSHSSSSGVSKKTLRPHRPLISSGAANSDGGRDEGHALTADVDPEVDEIRLAPAKSGSVTIHDEYVVRGSGGNACADRQRRTYVIAYRDREIVEAERRIGFTHSHNDVVNWDTFADHCRTDNSKEENDEQV